MYSDLARRLTPAHVSLIAYPTHSNNKPSQCNIQITESVQQGKYSIASRSLGRGDVILKETPFIQQLRYNLRQSHCYHCFKAIVRSHVPCHVKSCLWKLKYCSKACEYKGWLTSHSWLCRFPELDADSYSDVLFALEGYIASRTMGQNVLPEIVSNIDMHEPSQLEEYRRKIEVISPLFYLSEHAIESLVIICCQIRCNSFAVKQATSVAAESLVVSRTSIHLGQAVYLTAGKFNHDCDPGALVIFGSDDDPCQLQVQCIKQKIDSGNEITISYGPLATKHTTKERREKLLQDYFFDCNCSSCIDESGETLESIYKCQICKTGRLYRYQSECKDCGQNPYWAHFMKVEAEAEDCMERQNYLGALQLQEGIYHKNVLKLGQTYDRLAQLYCMNNQMATAAKYSLKSLEVTQHVFGKISVEAAEEMMKLSTLLFNSQQKSAAIKQIKETMIVYKILGIDKSAPEDIEELEDMKNYLTFIAH